MKIRIVGGELIAEVIEDDAFGIEEAKRRLREIADGVSPEKLKAKPGNKYMGKLGKSPKMPI